MPYKDPEKRKAYQRDYSRRRRAGSPKKSPSNLPGTLKVTTARDVLELLSETIGEVREAEGETFVKARVIGYLAGVTLKAVETADLEARLAALEKKLHLEAET
jgi:hypothetical protein